MEFGKLVSDLDIDNDTVLLSNDISALSQNVISSDAFKEASNSILSNAVDQIKSNIASFINMNAISNSIFDAMKQQVLDEYVLKKMLSTLMFDIISTYNDIALDCLDGDPDNETNINAGGAY